METIVRGKPLELLTIGLTLAETGRYSTNRTISVDPDTVREWLGTSVSDAAVKTVNKFINAEDPEQLANAVQQLDLPRDRVGDAMEAADGHIRVHRDGVFRYTYIPKLIDEVDGGTIYMCKSLNTDKSMMAQDLDDDNAVVKVDNYEQYEVLRWEMLKDLPHGNKQIREQYGDRLSDAVLTKLVGDSGNAKTSPTQGSAGREQLTLSTGSRHHQRVKLQSTELRSQLEDHGELEQKSISKVVLFPTGTERNLSNNWWIAGSYGMDQSVAVANCNKSTYESLADLEQIVHVDDYIDSASEYEVITTDGEQTLGELDEYVVYTTSDESYPRITQPTVLEHLPRLLAEMCENTWKAPDLDQETIVIIGQSDAFNARPILKDAECALHTDHEVRNIGRNSHHIGREYLLYAKSRLGDWSWDTPELAAFEEQSWNLEMDNGGYELIETVAQLHDRGDPLYSETPQGRWD